MPDSHAILSPSASDRWLSCPASVRLSQGIPRGKESPYAAEGTTAHALGEIEASFAFGKITKRQHGVLYEKWLKGAELADYDILEMRRHIADYVTLLEERMAVYPNSILMLEQRMNTGIDSCWGTGDAVIVSPRHVEIVDLKYGAGVPVSAEGNSQLRLYACGALDTFGDTLGLTEIVRMTIFQPRLESISTDELTAEELRAWREEIRPIAQEALAGSERFGPSEKACRWCPASAVCRARIEQATAVDFATDPDVLSNEEIAEYLGKLSEIREWCNALENEAVDKMYSRGEHIPGWKVVRSGGKRVITDQDKAIDRLVTAGGYSMDQVSRVSVRTLGDLEKLVGRSELPGILGDVLVKSEGKPSLARESDSRPGIDPNNDAVSDFKEEPS